MGSILSSEMEEISKVKNMGEIYDIDHENSKKLKERRIFKISATLFYILLASLLLMTVIKTYKQKNITEPTVCKESWSDLLMSIIIWIALVIGGCLIAKALKFLKQIERFEEKNNRDKNLTNSIRSFEDTESDINEDVIRSNSLSQNNDSQKVRPSLSNGPTPWLTVVRNDAYETHRRLSTSNEVNINVENK